MDYLFIVKIIFSLIAFLFAFDTIAGEKETGTLKLVISNSVPRYCFLAGKFLGGYFTIIIPFLFSFLISLAIFYFQGMFIVTSENLARIILVLFTTFIYLSACFLLGILISSLFTRSRTVMTVLMFVWIVFVLGVPGLSKIFAEIVHPVKTDQVIVLEESLLRQRIIKE